MAEFLYDLRPVSMVTADAVGVPGQRVFYLQAAADGVLLTLLAEKEQVRALCESISQILDDLAAKGLPRPSERDEPTPAEMALRQPLDPLFRIGQLGLGYEAESDLIVLVAQEVPSAEDDEEQDDLLGSSEEEAEEELRIVRLWGTRAQMQALSRHGLDVVVSGRPLCAQCLQPMDGGEHFCIKKNGHAGHYEQTH